MFTIYLSSYNYRESFHIDKFILIFPNSLISLALQSNEDIIEITKDIVTPDTIQLLQTIILTDDIHHTDISYKKRLDYLGIDLPDIIYHLKYSEFRKQYPNIKFKSIPDYYELIIQIAQKLEFPELVQHLFESTSPDAYIPIDKSIFQDLIKSGMNIQIAIIFLKYRQVLYGLDMHDKYRLLKDIINLTNSDLFEIYLKLNLELMTNYNIANYLIHAIRDNPQDVEDYYKMIICLRNQTNRPVQLDMCNLFDAMYTGLFKNYSISNIFHNICPVLFYTAIIRGHIHMFDVILNIYFQQRSQLVDMSDEGKKYEFKSYMADYYCEFIDILLKTRDLITPDMSRFIVDYVKKLDESKISLVKNKIYA